MDEQTGWHLDKKVPISIIFALMAMGISGIWVIADIKRDVELLKATMLAQQERSVEDRALLREALKEMNAKLDRLIERQTDRQNGAPK